MGYIKEPKGVDLVIGPSVFNEKDRLIISEIITNYKRTGKLFSNENSIQHLNNKHKQRKRKAVVD